MPAIVVENVSKKFRLSCAQGPLDQGGRAPPRPQHVRGVLGPQGHQPEGRPGRDDRHPRPQRLGQVDPAQVHRRHPQAHAPARSGSGAHRLAARARRRLPPGPHRPRERLHQRVDPRDPAEGDREALRRHRRLRRARALHRPAGQELLVRHVRAPRLRGGHQRRPRHPARRRGAGRGRRGRSSASASTASRSSSRRARRSSSSPTPSTWRGRSATG